MILIQAVIGFFSLVYIVFSLAGFINAASWKVLYDEWRVMKLKFHLLLVILANGSIKFVMDDEDLIAPTAAWMNLRCGTLLLNNFRGYIYFVTIEYRSQNFTDLEWNFINTVPSVVNMGLKMYMDIVNYGSPTSTNLWYIIWEGYFEFRGIGANV